MSVKNDGEFVGYVGKKTIYKYYPYIDGENPNVLDFIRVEMVRNRESPDVIRQVTEEYLKCRRKCGLPTL